MTHRGARIAIGLLAGFVALTAIGGGVTILGGVDEFPLEWLAGTPFDDYTVPALILTIMVGGSALLAAVTIFTGRRISVMASMVAGLILVGYIVVEVLILEQVPPGLTVIEGVYFGLGLLLFGLGAYLWRVEGQGGRL